MTDQLPTIVRFGPTRKAETFLLQLGQALHAHGTPADRLEQSVGSCARALGLQAQLFATPTSFFAAFGAPGDQATHLVRVEPGEIDLGRLAELDALTDEVEQGRISSVAAEARLAAIVAGPRRWSRSASAMSFGVASGSAACFFGGSELDVACSGVLGTLLGVLAGVCGRRPALSRIFEPAAAALVTALALVAASLSSLSAEVVTLSALIVLVPGFTLTIALSELATRHWASGTARLAGAGVVFLTLGFGVALGGSVQRLLPELPAVVQAPLPGWAEVVALLVAPLAFAVLFGARKIDMPAILVASVAGYLGARLGAATLGPELGVCVGALVVGSGSNLLASVTGRPGLVTLVPGIMLLVPGSMGFRSVSSFLARDTVSGMEAAFQMGLVATSLVAGLLLAHALVPTRRAL
jgi:uncharacterized membrane protein YjjP (DUF1212 family)